MSSALGLTLGAALIGVLFSTLFYGITLLQIAHFFSSSTLAEGRQKGWIALVCFVLISETTHTALSWMWIYQTAVQSFGDVQSLYKITWPFVGTIAAFALTAAVVQASFTSRIYAMSGRMLYVIPLWLMQLGEVAMVGILAYFALQSSDFFDFRQHWNFLVYLVLGTSAAIDILNSALLSLCLRRMDRGPQDTHSVINSAILYVIETGLFQAMLAAATLILWATQPFTHLWIAVLMVHAKMHSNSLMGTLNAKAWLRQRIELKRLITLGNTSFIVGHDRRMTLAFARPAFRVGPRISARSGPYAPEIPELAFRKDLGREGVPSSLWPFSDRKDSWTDTV